MPIKGRKDRAIVYPESKPKVWILGGQASYSCSSFWLKRPRKWVHKTQGLSYLKRDYSLRCRSTTRALYVTATKVIYLVPRARCSFGQHQEHELWPSPRFKDFWTGFCSNLIGWNSKMGILCIVKNRTWLTKRKQALGTRFPKFSQAEKAIYYAYL